jgi:hypothetical protein
MNYEKYLVKREAYLDGGGRRDDVLYKIETLSFGRLSALFQIYDIHQQQSFAGPRAQEFPR